MKNDFTQGKIVPALIRFVFPIMFAMLIQSLYGAVDLMIVGQFSDAANVSAVSVGSQLMQSLTMFFTELAVGTTVLLGQYIGQQRQDKCGAVVGATTFFFAGMGLVLAVAMQWLSAPAARILNAPAEAFAQTVAYTRICCAGAVFIVAYNILGSVFRGIGDAKMPLVTVAIAAVFNVFGDLLFVAGLHRGAAGAAIATVMAQALSVVLSFLIIRRRGMPFPFSRRDIGFHKKVIGRILRLGAPIAFIGFFNGCSRTTFVMAQGIAGAFGVRVPLSILFSHMKPVSIFRIGLATPSSTFVQIILCFLYFFHCRKEYVGTGVWRE